MSKYSKDKSNTEQSPYTTDHNLSHEKYYDYFSLSYLKNGKLHFDNLEIMKTERSCRNYYR